MAPLLWILLPVRWSYFFVIFNPDRSVLYQRPFCFQVVRCIPNDRCAIFYKNGNLQSLHPPVSHRCLESTKKSDDNRCVFFLISSPGPTRCYDSKWTSFFSVLSTPTILDYPQLWRSVKKPMQGMLPHFVLVTRGIKKFSKNSNKCFSKKKYQRES